MFKKIIYYIVLIILLFLCLGIFEIWWGEVGIYHSEKFSIDKWKLISGDTSWCGRGRMAGDLIKILDSTKYITKDKIREMLGKPDEEIKKQFSYELGLCRTYGMETEYLYIEFNKDKYVKAYIVHL